MRCFLLFSCSTSLIVLSFIAVDAQPNSLRLPVASLPVPGNPPYPISRASDYLYPNVTAATPARYLNPTGTASYPVYNATDVTCAGPNGEKGKLRKRLVSMYASSGIPRPSGEATLEAECSIEVHVQPEASLISFLAQANEVHLTEDNLLGVSSTPTVNTPIPKVMGDTVEIDYGPPKPASAKPTRAKTSAAAYNANDLTDMQMSQLHAALQPTQTEPPNKPAQSLSASSSDLESSSSSTIAPPQGLILNAQSSLTPHAVASKVLGADSSSNGAVGESSPNGKPEGAGTPSQPNASGSALKSVSPSGRSSSHFAQGGFAQPGADSSNVGSSRPGSSSGSESGASGSVSLGSGSSSGSGSGLGFVSTESNSPASGSDSSPGPSSSVISSSGEIPSDVGTAPCSDSGSPNSGIGPGSLPGSSGSGSSGSSTDSSPLRGSGPGSSNTGSCSVPGLGSNIVGSRPQSLSAPSDSDASRTGSGFNGAGIIAVGSQTYTAQQTGSFVVVGSYTVINGAPAITIASTPVSIGANEVLVAGSNTLALNQAADQTSGPDAIAIGSHSYTVQRAASVLVVGSKTVTQGAPAVTIASEPVSLGTNSMLVAGSKTLALGAQATGGSGSVPDAILSQGGPTPAPSGNSTSNGGLASNNGSSSSGTGAKPFDAGGVRSWDTVERWTGALGASIIVAVVTCGLL